MKIQSRHVALTVLFALISSTALLAQETPAEPSGDTPTEQRAQRQDRARIHQPADGIAVQQRTEVQARSQDRARIHQPADGIAVRERTETRVRAENRIRMDGAAAARAEARQRARGNASGARNVTRQRARVHRPGR